MSKTRREPRRSSFPVFIDRLIRSLTSNRVSNYIRVYRFQLSYRSASDDKLSPGGGEVVLVHLITFSNFPFWERKGKYTSGFRYALRGHETPPPATRQPNTIGVGSKEGASGSPKATEFSAEYGIWWMVFFSLSILEKKKSAHKHTTGFICGRRNATIIRLRSRYKKLPCAKSASPMPRHGPASARPVPSCYLDIFISTHAYIYLYIKGSTTVDEEKSGVCINPFGFCWLETEKRKKEPKSEWNIKSRRRWRWLCSLTNEENTQEPSTTTETHSSLLFSPTAKQAQ